MTENAPNAMPAVGAVPMYPDVPHYINLYGGLQVWEGDGWKAESMAWKESCYVASNLNGAMQVTYSGPDAQAFLSKMCINNVYNWEIGTSKHLVMTDEHGLIANHGLAIRDGETTFRQLASIPWAVYQSFSAGMDFTAELNQIFILQVAGPTSVRVIERVLGKSLRDLDFLQIRKVQIPGVPAELDLEVSRIGMVGTLAYELRGPFEAGPAVYDAVYQAGKDLGIKRLGWRTYMVNHTEGGFPQLNGSFTASCLADEGFANSPFGFLLIRDFTGSIDPADLRARFRTPGEVNWLWMAKFDHDFIGRSAVEAEAADRKRKTVILRWNPEDVADIQASMFQQGEEYKTLEFPCTPQSPAGGHADLVTKNGKAVGISSYAVYSYYYREMLSQCTLDLDEAGIGNEVTLHWGDFGKRIKEVRATVARFPYLDLPSNKDYDLASVPSDL